MGGIIILLIIITVFFVFFYSKKCKDKDCFDTFLYRCDKAKYINIGEDSSWFYQIKGRGFNNLRDIFIKKSLMKDTCSVYVKNLDLKNAENAKKLGGKGMICSIPYRLVMNPESNIDYCHGELKEAMQDIIINNMHLFIIQNIGELKASEMPEKI